MENFREMIKSKIYRVTITKKGLRYSGSIGIDKAFLLKSNIVAGEKVQVVNFNNGQRLIRLGFLKWRTLIAGLYFASVVCPFCGQAGWSVSIIGCFLLFGCSKPGLFINI